VRCRRAELEAGPPVGPARDRQDRHGAAERGDEAGREDVLELGWRASQTGPDQERSGEQEEEPQADAHDVAAVEDGQDRQGGEGEPGGGGDWRTQTRRTQAVADVADDGSIRPGWRNTYRSRARRALDVVFPSSRIPVDEPVGLYRLHDRGEMSGIAEEQRLKLVSRFYRQMKLAADGRWAEQAGAGGSLYFAGEAVRLLAQEDRQLARQCVMLALQAGGVGRSISWRAWLGLLRRSWT